MSDNDKTIETMFLLGAINRGIQENTAQDLHDDWYSPEEIADELDMDEDEVREIVDDWDE